MKERIYETPNGSIHYWINEQRLPAEKTLIFLPGLTADHRLFEKQLDYFSGKYNLLVWDAPGHGASWPFRLDFTLADKAKWLDEIIRQEKLENCVIVGQSMGGYLGQAYMELFPGKLRGFVSVDSAPLQRKYVTAAEIWLLKRMEPVYRYYPWKWLLSSGSKGCAVSEYGIRLMREIMMTYDGDKQRYAQLSGHGFRMLAEAMEADLPYRIDCPALLLCGVHDQAGSAKRYNRRWAQETGIPIVWLENAGHNSNTDQPERVNVLIEELVKGIENEQI